MIAAFGDAVVDLFALPRGADVGTATQFLPCPGGAPNNVALVAARLGAPCRFIGAVGADAHGDRVVACLADAGADTRSVVRLAARRTGVTFVRVGLDGSRSFLSYRPGGADLALEPAHLAALPAAPLEGVRWLHLASSALCADPMAKSTRAILAEARARGVAVSLDLNVRAHLWDDVARMRASVRELAQGAALVKASEEDLAALELSPTLDALATLLAPGARGVLTLAERGAVARVGGADIAVPAPRVELVDATGAGDAFVGAVLAALALRGLGPDAPGFHDAGLWHAITAMACAVGARAVTQMGATEALRADVSAERAALREICARG